jgi:hypothetical protein
MSIRELDRGVLAFALPLLVVLPAVRLVAQSTPRDVVQEYFVAIDDRRWSDAVAVLDPEQLGPARENMLGVLVGWIQQRDELRRMRRRRRSSGGLTPLSFDGTLAEALSRFGDTPLPAIPGVRTLRDLAALPTPEFTARLLEASDLRSEEGFRRMAESSTRRILGAVAESDSVAHVLYRSEGPDVRNDDPYHVEVVATVRRGERWYVRRRPGEAGSGSLAFLVMRLEEADEAGRRF